MSEQARESEKFYHEELYSTHELFMPGSWLHKPAAYVTQSFENIPLPAGGVRALDLGAGVGRHSIPLAKYLGTGSEVVCVDILDAAIKKLDENAAKHDVKESITGIVSDVEGFSIEPQSFDFVLSVSCIEHVPTKIRLEKLIKQLQEGTRPSGSHCFMMITDNVWQDRTSGEQLEPVLEQNLQSAETIAMLEALYTGWQIYDLSTAPWEAAQNINGRDIFMTSTSVRFTAQK